MVSLQSLNVAIRVNSVYRTAGRRIQTFVTRDHRKRQPALPASETGESALAKAGEVEARDDMLAVGGVGLDGCIGGSKTGRVVFQPDDETRWTRAAPALPSSCTDTRAFVSQVAGFE